MMTNNYVDGKLKSQKTFGENFVASAKSNFFNGLKNSLGVFLLLLLAFSGALAQDRTISGTIRDAAGEGIPGVSVYAKGTSKGTITDVDGKYQISVPAGTTLVFQSVGYLNQEIVVGEQATLDLVMQDDVQKLNEVVVVGYGTQLKKDLTGSVASIDSKDFNPGPIVNPLQQLNGRAAGVSINQVGSEPGVAPNIRIRGITSLAGGNDPLVVIDGIQGGMDLLNQLPPSEIVSYDILKDASATAIYGSRGAAGVLLITTKKGQEGRTTVEYNMVGSMEIIAKKYDMLSASEWRAEATKRGIAASADFGGNSDWFKEISRTGYTQNHNLAFGGGTNNFNYRASLTAILQDGIIINSGSKNYIGRIQATQRGLNDKLTLTYNVNIGFLDKKYNGLGVIGTAISRRPTDPIYNQDGSYFNTDQIFNYVNPYARAKEIIDGEKTNSLFGSLRADYEIIKGLTASVFGSWRKTDGVYGQYYSRNTTDPNAKTIITDSEGKQTIYYGTATRQSKASNERLLNLILNYKKIIGDHSFDGTFVYEWQKQIYEGFTAKARGFVNDINGLDALKAGTLGAAQTGDLDSYKNDRTLVSFLGRINYSYKDRYMLTVSVRRDGSSVFGKNNKWANFPALSLAWRITEEGFFKSQKLFDDLKLRAGFGITGNQQGLSPLNSVQLVEASGSVFFNGNSITNFAIAQNANPNLKWETREMYNVGVDFSLLKGKLNGTVDYYYGNTKNLLFRYTVPQPPYPFGEIYANIGTVLNTGIEITLNYSLINTKDLGVNLGGNFTSNKTKVVELSGSLNGVTLNTDYVSWGAGGTTGVASTNNDISYLIKGQPIGTFNLFKHVGVDDQGTQIIADVDGNGSVDDGRLSKDRVVVGQPLPKFTFGFTPSMRYKNFDLNLVLRGGYGNKIYNSRRALLSSMAQFGQSNVLKGASDMNINNVNYASDFWLEDGSFARLENVTLGYRFQTNSWKAVQALRLSFTVNNLFLITNYKGIDPEVNQNGGRNDGAGFGIDNGIYPRTRNFSLGLNVTFK